MPFEEQVVLLYAGINGHFDGTPAAEMKTFQEKYIDFIKKLYSEVLDVIRTTGELSGETEEKLKKAIAVFKKL